MYSILKKGRENNLSIECQFELFDRAVLPVILYGSEIWGFEKLDILERIHLKFCKLLLHLKQSTPDCIIYTELGRYPIALSAKVRMINFWGRLLLDKESKISHLLYKLLLINFNNYGLENKCLMHIKNILDSCGMSDVWNQQYADKWVAKNVEQVLKDQFQQLCLSQIDVSPKCLCYRIFKTEFKFEHYFNILSNNFMYILCKFRCGSHRLPVETGRWHGLSRSDRLCHLCGSSDIGDEYHYILSCKSLKEDRKKLLPDYCCKNPNAYKFNSLFNSSNTVILENLCRFIKIINVKVSPPS